MSWLKDLEEIRKNESWRDGSEGISLLGKHKDLGFYPQNSRAEAGIVVHVCDLSPSMI